MSIHVQIHSRDREIKRGQLVPGDKFIAFEGVSTPGVKFAARVTRLVGVGSAGRATVRTAVARFQLELSYDELVFIPEAEYNSLRAAEALHRLELVQRGLQSDAHGWSVLGPIIRQRNVAAGLQNTQIHDVNIQ